MPSINYNSPESQAGFQARNLIEETECILRFPNRYWMTLSIDAPTTSKWEAQAYLNDVSIMEIWDQQIRRYFAEIASKLKTDLICIWGVDDLQAFHSVVLSKLPVYEEHWYKNWPFAKRRWLNPSDGKEVFGKIVAPYDGSQRGMPYIFHHHDTSVHYFRHRPRGRRKDPPVVYAINELIQRNIFSPLDEAAVKSELEAPTTDLSLPHHDG